MAWLFAGTQKIQRSSYSMPMPRYSYLLILAYLAGMPAFYDDWIISYTIYAPYVGYQRSIFQFLIPNGLFTLQYIIVGYSTLLVAGSFMTRFIEKCECAHQSPTILVDSKCCVASYQILRTRMGMLLLLMMTKYSLYVMADTFMTYLLYEFSALYGVWMVILYGLLSVMAVLILTYLCMLCEDCTEALRSLLVPLRCRQKILCSILVSMHNRRIITLSL
jgi:hypothetical protein